MKFPAGSLMLLSKLWRPRLRGRNGGRRRRLFFAHRDVSEPSLILTSVSLLLILSGVLPPDRLTNFWVIFGSAVRARHEADLGFLYIHS
jgi:hypothetical protein